MTREALAALALVLAAACGSKSHATADAAIDAFDGCPANCDPHSQYCFDYASGALPNPGCVALPTSCASAPTCACIEATLSASCITCTGSAATGFIVSCANP